MNADQVEVVILFGCVGLILAGFAIRYYLAAWTWYRLAGYVWVFVMAFWLFFWAAGVGGLG